MSVESDDGQIFLPKEKSCHGEPIILKKTSGNLYKGTKCVIFSLKGTKNSLSFVGRCQNESCQKKFYPFYVDNKIDDLIVRKYYKPEKYFGTTNETIFEIDLLNLMLSMLFHCWVSQHCIQSQWNDIQWRFQYWTTITKRLFFHISNRENSARTTHDCEKRFYKTFIGWTFLLPSWTFNKENSFR